MICVRDRGRLCNNILQYGHLYAWGREHGRETMSMRFAYKYRYFHICHTRHHHFLAYVAAKYAAKLRLLPVVSFDEPEADYSREEALMLSRRHIVAQGWYARWYDLFLKYKEDIINLFAFDEDVRRGPDSLLARSAAAMQQAVDRSHSSQQDNGLPDNAQRHGDKGLLRLGVHVRRGDYATWQGGRYLYTDRQYAALTHSFIRLHPEKTVQVFVCGNDPSLQRSLYEEGLPQGSVVFPEGNPGEDLYLLSQCDYLIGPPSTFTLVAAMYRDLPLCWIEQPDKPLTEDCFSHFDDLFRHIR